MRALRMALVMVGMAGWMPLAQAQSEAHLTELAKECPGAHPRVDRRAQQVQLWSLQRDGDSTEGKALKTVMLVDGELCDLHAGSAKVSYRKGGLGRKVSQFKPKPASLYVHQGSTFMKAELALQDEKRKPFQVEVHVPLPDEHFDADHRYGFWMEPRPPQGQPMRWGVVLLNPMDDDTGEMRAKTHQPRCALSDMNAMPETHVGKLIQCDLGTGFGAVLMVPSNRQQISYAFTEETEPGGRSLQVTEVLNKDQHNQMVRVTISAEWKRLETDLEATPNALNNLSRMEVVLETAGPDVRVISATPRPEVEE